MNFADLENTWRSPHNQPSAAQLEHDRKKFVTDLKRRHRGLTLFLGVVFLALAVITARFAMHLVAPARGADAVDFTREWAILPLLALPWCGWGLLLWKHLRHRSRHADYSQSIGASVRALLDENRVERARTRLVAWLIAGMLLLVPLIVHQLRAVGKAGDEIVVPAFVILPLIELGILAAMAWRYRRKLLPRKRELEALLHSYQ